MGVCGDVSYTHNKIFDELLTVDVVRGKHSTGVAVIGGDRKTHIVKKVGPATALLDSKEYNEATKGVVKCIIGHNRYATRGNVTEANAHPFDFPTVVGAHNGTLNLSTQRKLKNGHLFDTDSQAIFNHLDEHSVTDTLNLIYDHKWAKNAYALVWYDKLQNTINFYRNSERTLFWALSEDECTLYWASELGMLQWILRRNGIKTHKGAWYNVNEDTHHSFIVPKDWNTKFKPPKLIKWEAPPEPDYSKIAARNYSHPLDEWEDWSHSFNHDQGHQNVLAFPKKPAELKTIPLIDTSKWRHPYKLPDGSSLKRPIVEDMVKEGCVICDKFKPEDWRFGKFIYPLKYDLDGRPMFLCEECYNKEEVRETMKDAM